MSNCAASASYSCAFPGDDVAHTTATGAGRVVRFDAECELITLDSEHKQRPVLTTKSYSLPLWKKPSSFLLPSASNKSYTSAPMPSEQGLQSASLSKDKAKDRHVVLKVSIPRFKSQSKLTPTRTLPPTNELKPLSPCLVHRDTSPTSSQTCAPRLEERRPSLPAYLSQPAPGKRCTVPLRSCCKACFSAIEQSARLGDEWEIKLPPSHYPGYTQRRVASDGETRRVKDFSDVTVDEVEALRLSVGFDREPMESFSESRGVGLTIDALCANSSPSAAASAALSRSPTSPLPSPVVKTPVDYADDDDQLFPLPSCPKIRTPSPRSSPNPSPSPEPHLPVEATEKSTKDILTQSATISRVGGAAVRLS